MAAHRRFRERSGRPDESDAAPTTEVPAASGSPARSGLWRQLATIARRQVALLVADRRYLAFLALLPFLVGLLPLTVAGDAGFNEPPVGGSAPLEPKHLIALLNFGAVLMGTTLTVRDLVGERAIFRREQAVGLSASAYLLAKIGVFGAIAVIQSALLVLVVTAPGIGKAAPTGAAVLGSPDLRVVRRCRSHVGGRGDPRPGGVGGGENRRPGHRAAGGGAHGTVRARGRLHPGDRPPAARHDLVVHPRALGVRRDGIHG